MQGLRLAGHRLPRLRGDASIHRRGAVLPRSVVRDAGHVRGGCEGRRLASGLMGSMSGSVTLQRVDDRHADDPGDDQVGVSAALRSRIQACASTGGTLMPPIMGATAFVMANFLGISYAEVAIAARSASALYFSVASSGRMPMRRGPGSRIAARSCRAFPRRAEGRAGTTSPCFAFLIWMLLGLRRRGRGAVLFLGAAAGDQPGLLAPRPDEPGAFAALPSAVSRLLIEIAAIRAGVGSRMVARFGDGHDRRAGDGVVWPAGRPCTSADGRAWRAPSWASG